MSFQVSALSNQMFAQLYGKDSESLAEYGARRVIVDAKPGYPCRVSLVDAEIGEAVILLNYEHQPSASPYRSSHAIFVKDGAVQASPNTNEIPEFLRHRLLSVRAFDTSAMLIDADVCDGQELENVINRMFLNSSAEYLHLHNARTGCYVARVERA
jgi:hypothetical protein